MLRVSFTLFIASLLACNALVDLDALGPASASATSAGQGGHVAGAGGEAGNGAGGAPQGWLEGWGRRKRVTVSPRALVARTLTDFPLAITLAADAELAAVARGGSSAIAFTDAQGSLLNHEVEMFDSGSGALAAWVRVPTLATQSVTQLWLYYDNPAATSPAGQDTWHAGFEAVWHFARGGALAVAVDSSSGAHDGAATPVSTPASSEGIAGHAADFDGVDDLYVVGDPADGSLDFGQESFSISLWVLVDSSVGWLDKPLFKGASAPPDPGYGFELGTDGWYLDLEDGVLDLAVHFGDEPAFIGSWTHLAVVLNRDTEELRGYVNGLLVSAVDVTGLASIDNDSPLLLGDNSWPFHGRLDEARVVRAALPAEWIALEHQNLRPPGMVQIGAEESSR